MTIKSSCSNHSLPWSLLGIALVVGVAALLQAQSLSDHPSQERQDAVTSHSASTQSAATQPTTTRPEVSGQTEARKSAASTEDPEPRREPTPTEILRALTKKGEAAPRPVVRPTPPHGQVARVSDQAIPANAVAPVTPKLLPDGYRLVDRTGRLAREGDYWVFSFENRSRGDAEMPIRLLPNRLLEDMEVVSEGGMQEVVFVVSGEVTEYHGVNYLLVQKLLTRPNLGNLK